MKVKSKMVKFNALFDLASQSNLISKDLLVRLGLPSISHPCPYCWVSGNSEFKVTQ